MGKAAVFLDRDDTLIENVPYLGDPEKVKLLPGAKEAIQRLHRKGLPLIVVSDQQGAGPGSGFTYGTTFGRLLSFFGLPPLLCRPRRSL